MEISIMKIKGKLIDINNNGNEARVNTMKARENKCT